MKIIFTFVFLILLTTVSFSVKNNKTRSIIYLISCFICVLLFTHRSDNAPDVIPYKDIFYNTYTYEGTIESLFLASCKLFNGSNLQFIDLLAFYTILLFIIWHLSTKPIIKSNMMIPLLVFISSIGIFYYGIVLRAAIAITICYAGISRLILNKNFKNYLIYYILTLFSIGFHQQAFIFLILPLFIFKNYSNLILYILTLIALIVPILNLDRFITIGIEYIIRTFGFDRFNAYLIYHTIESDNKLSLNFIKCIILSFIFIFLKNKILLDSKERISYNAFLIIYILGNIINSSMSFIQSGSRLSSSFHFFEFILVSMIFYHTNYKITLKLVTLFALCIINFYALINGIPLLFKY